MSDLPHLWRLSWVAELGRHLAVVLSPHLPPGRELIATERTVTLLVRPEEGPLRVVSTYELPVPTEAAVLDARAAHGVLADLQVDVARHLGRAWPVTEEGVALSPRTRDGAGGIVELQFVASDGKEVIELAPFVTPAPFDEARPAG